MKEYFDSDEIRIYIGNSDRTALIRYKGNEVIELNNNLGIAWNAYKSE